jgi:hypothetical protein
MIVLVVVFVIVGIGVILVPVVFCRLSDGVGMLVIGVFFVV